MQVVAGGDCRVVDHCVQREEGHNDDGDYCGGLRLHVDNNRHCDLHDDYNCQIFHHASCDCSYHNYHGHSDRDFSLSHIDHFPAFLDDHVGGYHCNYHSSNDVRPYFDGGCLCHEIEIWSGFVMSRGNDDCDGQMIVGRPANDCWMEEADCFGRGRWWSLR